MIDILNRLSEVKTKLNDLEQSKYSVDVLIRLCEKLKYIDHNGVMEQLSTIVSSLEMISNGDFKNVKIYLRQFNVLKKSLRSDYELFEEGSIRNEYMALGLVFGVAFGSVFSFINIAFIGIGLPIGLAVGVGIGASKERELKEQGKLY